MISETARERVDDGMRDLETAMAGDLVNAVREFIQ